MKNSCRHTIEQPVTWTKDLDINCNKCFIFIALLLCLIRKSTNCFVLSDWCNSHSTEVVTKGFQYFTWKKMTVIEIYLVNKHRKKQTKKQTNKQTNKQTKKQTKKIKQTKKQTNKWTNKRTNKQTNRASERTNRTETHRINWAKFMK